MTDKEQVHGALKHLLSKKGLQVDRVDLTCEGCGAFVSLTVSRDGQYIFGMSPAERAFVNSFEVVKRGGTEKGLCGSCAKVFYG
jgi:hypothetical protein